MSLVHCPACNAANRPPATYCMRCGKPLPPPDCAASRHARAFAERERRGPWLGAFPDALDFSPASLAVLDTLMRELWGEAGEAPGMADWQPPAAKMPVVIDFGAYLGEVLCRALPARWEMNPAHPEVVIAARVIDSQGRRINPFAQVGARFRDGAQLGLASLYTALTGRALPPWQMPAAPPPAARPAAQPPAPSTPSAPPRVVDAGALLQQAAAHVQRGHHGNAIQCLRQVLAAQPGHRQARRELILALGQAGAADEALREVDEQRRLAPADVEWTDLRALLQLQAGRIDDALGTLDMALMKQPDEPRLLRRRAFALLKGGRWARAQAELTRLQARGDDAELALGLAQALIQLGQAAAARSKLERLLAGSLPGTRPELQAAAREKLAELAAPAQQRAQPQPAAAVPAPAADAARQAYSAAVEHARNQRFAQALPLFIQAARLRPDYPAYLKDVGHCLHDLGRSAEAREWFESCLAVDPGYSAARRALGVVAEATGDQAAAISRYREVLSRLDSDPRDVDVAMRRLKALGALPG